MIKILVLIQYPKVTCVIHFAALKAVGESFQVKLIQFKSDATLQFWYIGLLVVLDMFVCFPNAVFFFCQLWYRLYEKQYLRNICQVCTIFHGILEGYMKRMITLALLFRGFFLLLTRILYSLFSFILFCVCVPLYVRQSVHL